MTQLTTSAKLVVRTDKILNFWLKQLDTVHKYYAQCFTKIIYKTEEIPEWLMEVCTYYYY